MSALGIWLSPCDKKKKGLLLLCRAYMSIFRTEHQRHKTDIPLLSTTFWFWKWQQCDNLPSVTKGPGLPLLVVTSLVATSYNRMKCKFGIFHTWMKQNKKNTVVSNLMLNVWNICVIHLWGYHHNLTEVCGWKTWEGDQTTQTSSWDVPLILS